MNETPQDQAAHLSKLEDMFRCGHHLYHNGQPEKARAVWKSVTMGKWEFCKAYGYDALKTRVLSGRWIQNIGHFIFLDAYLKLFKLGLLADTTNICLFTDLYSGNRVSNNFLLSLYAEHLTIRTKTDATLSDSFRATLHWLREDFEYVRLNDTEAIGMYEMVLLANERWDSAKLPPLIKITPEIDLLGKEFLRKNGINDDDWFVCVHARTPGYHPIAKGNDASVRDSDILAYQQLFNKIIEWGGKVVRLGNTKMPPVPRMAGVLDYTTIEVQDPLIDIYLAAKCRFFVGSVSGIALVANLFKTPIIQVNYAPMGERPLFPDTYWTQKAYRCRSSGKRLSFGQLREKGCLFTEHADSLRQANVEVVDHTPEELVDSVSYFFDHAILNRPVSAADEAVQISHAKFLDEAHIIGVGKVVPTNARQFFAE